MNRYIKKTIRISLFALTMIFAGVGTRLQIEYENYRIRQEKDYNIIKSKERESYKPVILYHIERVFGFHSIDEESSYILYEGVISQVISSNGFKDAYIVHCYYSEKDKRNYLSRNIRDSKFR